MAAANLPEDYERLVGTTETLEFDYMKARSHRVFGEINSHDGGMNEPTLLPVKEEIFYTKDTAQGENDKHEQMLPVKEEVFYTIGTPSFDANVKREVTDIKLEDCECTLSTKIQDSTTYFSHEKLKDQNSVSSSEKKENISEESCGDRKQNVKVDGDENTLETSDFAIIANNRIGNNGEQGLVAEPVSHVRLNGMVPQPSGKVKDLELLTRLRKRLLNKNDQTSVSNNKKKQIISETSCSCKYRKQDEKDSGQEITSGTIDSAVIKIEQELQDTSMMPVRFSGDFMTPSMENSNDQSSVSNNEMKPIISETSCSCKIRKQDDKGGGDEMTSGSIDSAVIKIEQPLQEASMMPVKLSGEFTTRSTENRNGFDVILHFYLEIKETENKLSSWSLGPRLGVPLQSNHIQILRSFRPVEGIKSYDTDLMQLPSSRKCIKI